MEKISKKQEIIEAALELFSENGYEATSVSQIVEAVGIKKASLYFHFASKQDILDSIIKMTEEEYLVNSYVRTVNEEDSEDLNLRFGDMSRETITKQVMAQFNFVLHDSHAKKFRKLLFIEQYKNAELGGLLTQRSYEDILRFNREVMELLISHNILKDYDVEIMASQFAFPISMWIGLCDRDPGREEEVLGLIERHVAQFFEIYGV